MLSSLRVILILKNWQSKLHFYSNSPLLHATYLLSLGVFCLNWKCFHFVIYFFSNISSEFNVFFVFSGSHITPVIRYVDDIIFEKLEEKNDNCQIHGHSFSTVCLKEYFQNNLKCYFFLGTCILWLYNKLLQHEKSHGWSRIYWFRRVQGRIEHRFMHAVW